MAAAGCIAAYLERVHWRPGTAGGPGTLTRVSHGGSARGIGGLLEDYAFCAEGLLALYAATGRTRWYRLAEDLLGAAGARFVADGTLRDTAGESEQVFNAQGRRAALDPFDGATPSGAAAFAGALLSHSALSGSSRIPGPGREHPCPAPAPGGPSAPGGRLAARDGAGRAGRPGGGRRRRARHAGAGGTAPGAAALAQPRAGDRPAAGGGRAGAAPAARPGRGARRLASGLPVPRHGLWAPRGFCRGSAGAPRQHRRR